MLYPRTDWEDCADCLCAVCVRNADNDMSSESLGEVLNPCHCDGTERCRVVEFEEDCIGEGFVPDDADKDERWYRMSDLISRQDAIDILDDFEADIELGEMDSYKTYREKLLSLPSADRPTGHIVTNFSGIINPTVWAECSECGGPIDAWDKYCRHCGTKMEE